MQRRLNRFKRVQGAKPWVGSCAAQPFHRAVVAAGGWWLQEGGGCWVVAAGGWWLLGGGCWVVAAGWQLLVLQPVVASQCLLLEV
jgi:hypothetical protein